MPRHTRGIYSGATTHICVSMQGARIAKNQVMLKDSSTLVMKTKLKLRLFLRTEIYLNLLETFVVPSFR